MKHWECCLCASWTTSPDTMLEHLYHTHAVRVGELVYRRGGENGRGFYNIDTLDGDTVALERFKFPPLKKDAPGEVAI
jgi:hypothetical protein